MASHGDRLLVVLTGVGGVAEHEIDLPDLIISVRDLAAVRGRGRRGFRQRFVQPPRFAV